MSSVEDLVPCEQCKDIAFLIFRCRSGEVSIQCPVCGYTYERQVLIDRKRQVEDPEHGEYCKLTKDDRRIYREYVRKGYGAYYVEFDDGGGFLGSFHKPITPKQIAKFKKYISRQGVIEDTSYLTRWNEDTKQVEAVIGTIVNPLTEFNDGEE